jgi:hypothetical protein
MQILPQYFLITVVLTFIVLYLLYPSPKIIIKYPSIKNDISDLYVDDNNICYKYHKTQISCAIKK